MPMQLWCLTGRNWINFMKSLVRARYLLNGIKNTMNSKDLEKDKATESFFKQIIKDMKGLDKRISIIKENKD